MKPSEEGEPLTPAGRFFLQPDVQQVINLIIGFENPIDVDAVKSEIKHTLLKHHPRFSSVLVRDRWTQTDIDLDKHVMSIEDDDIASSSVNDYVADLASISCPLSPDKPLWEVHVLARHRCIVMRIHHALGDGISLMSLFLACCRCDDKPQLLPSVPKAAAARPTKMRLWVLLRKLVLVVWFTLIYAAEFVLRSLWVRDEESPISGGSGVEFWPRRLVTVRFRLEDMKFVGRAVNGTINDVFMGIISCGLSKYLQQQQPSEELREQIRVTGLAMVNTREQPGIQDLASLMKNKTKTRWGNQFGYILLPMYLKMENDPLEHVRRTKAMVDKKKLSLEAPFSYRIGALVMSLLGPKVATMLNYRIICNTTFHNIKCGWSS
ncbi:O-acyltransferase WSD1 [Acorus calamus]|uniref:O-acyltransferase WSD1 n=1 Tax=Acorus calamus TaxID=4465 RepID=A0AAV9DH28_ACOCL|nr:O-acyltransferase WSD1 [Acorus calamus]